MTETPVGDRDTSRVQVVVSYSRDRSTYPRTRPIRGGDVYWTNIAVQAATWRQVADPGTDFLVYASDEPRGDAARILHEAGADIQPQSFDHRPPDGFYGRYAGSLFILDTLAALVERVDDHDVLLFVDPDVVWAAAPDPLVEEVRRGGVVGYDLQVPDHLPMCEVSRRQQADIAAEILGQPPPLEPQAHFGGEFYGMLGSVLREVQPRIEEWWRATLLRFERGKPHFTVEEHLMNALLWERGEQDGRANPHLQRIRTLPPPFSTRDRMHPDLVAWHLPFEKARAFPALLRYIASGHAMPPADKGYRRWLSRRMGVEPTVRRQIADRGRQLKWALERRRANPSTPYGL